MIARALAASAAVMVLMSPVAARAQTAPATAQADVLFKDAKKLRDSGKITEACAKFEQSKQLASGVGVTLYLGDCYERAGRMASAWTQFLEAEKLARDRKDKRADVAHAHASTLAPKVNRIVVLVSPAISLANAELRIDGSGPVPQGDWKMGVAVDPGDHVVTFGAAGATPRTLNAHVDAGTLAVTLTIDDPPAAHVVPPAPAPVLAPVAVTPSESTAHGDLPILPARTWVGYGLIGAGVVGIGVGAALLAVKNQSATNDGPGGSPQVDQGAAVGSTIAFVAGGAALVSAVVLYLTAPADKESALSVVPAPIAGGGGAFLRGSF